MSKKLLTKYAGFTLVEIMVVVAIIALLAAIAVPGFLRARKRSQASKILNDLRLIDAAVDQYAVETGRKNTALYQTGQDLFREDYGSQVVDVLPGVPANAWNTLSDVAPTGFWSPYPTP
jgi:prepilin-type N-terminal cleavage/methylation domain-containing protein